MISTVTGKRQITIPAKIASEFGIEAGTKIEWEPSSDGSHIVLSVQESRKQMLDRARGIGRKYRDAGKNSVAILDTERGLDEEERLKSLRVAEAHGDYGKTEGKRE